MKRFTAIILAAVLVLSSAAINVSANTTENVFVTIADENGKLALARVAVTVSDIDADGAITINDALYAAHETFYEGGAAAGYASSMTEYGLSLTKLWGVENGGSYGYYVNDASAWSLTDPVAEGDHVYAFVYTDTVAWSDAYSWFDASAKDASAGDAITLSLSSLGYDADWNQVVSPVEGAKITVNGEDAGVVTDASGKAVITLDKAGTYTVSAKSDNMTLVPPVCVISVAAADTAVTPALPQTCTAPVAVYMAVGMLMLAMGCVMITETRKRNNEI